MLGVGRYGPLGRSEPDAAGGPAASARGPEGMTPSAPGERAPRPVGIDGRERDAWVVLAGAEGVGPVTFGRLVASFGSAAAVLDIARSGHGVGELVAASRGADGGAPTLAPAGARAIADAAATPDRLLEPVRRSGVLVLALADVSYPVRLRSIELPPPVLFVRGSVESLARPRAVAVVGTRRPTTQGRATAARIAEAVAGAGASIVSGLALGIDAAAHSAAVRVGTPTVAVIGGGHERLYPAGHRWLARAIVDGGGAVLSEFPPDMQPSRGTFPRRNRIISGLADATVIVEAGARSGALTTAAWALEQGRSLHIVPGRPEDPTVAGCLAFLREAGPDARVVAGIPELLEDLGYRDGTIRTDGAARRSGLPRAAAGGTGLTSVEEAIAVRLAAGLGTVDELVIATGEAPATVLGALTALEVRGMVIETFGRYRAAGSLAGGGGWRVHVPVVAPRPGGRQAA